MAELAAPEDKNLEEENNYEANGEVDLEGELMCALDEIEKLRIQK